MDRNQPLSLRGYNTLERMAKESSMLSATGSQLDATAGNPIIVESPRLERPCTARITGIAFQSDGVTPLLTATGALQYTWTEEQRFVSGPGGSPSWVDVTELPRQSVKLAPGVYLNLAHEAQDGQATQDHVIMWAGALNVYGTPDNEHVFYECDNGFAVASADWVEGTWRTGNTSSPGTDDYVLCYRCADMDGGGQMGIPVSPFPIYFYKRAGLRDPAVFGPYTNYYGSQSGDVIKYAFDYKLQQFYCISDAYDDALGCIKYGKYDISKIRQGWHIIDGTTPTGSKIGALDDTRGLFTRATDKPATGNLWSDKGAGSFENYNGAADNTGGNGGTGAWGAGGRAGISSSRQLWGNNVAATQTVVQDLLDVKSWTGPTSDGDPNPLNDVVVCPPAWVYCQIIRFK